MPARERDGLVELTSPPDDPALHNPDLDPTTREQRTWGRWSLAALWVGMSVCVPTYILAANLIQSGMNWWQAMLTILLGNLIVLVPMVLCGHAGTRYGIPFPVFARAAFGIRGAHVPSLARALVACGWFGIQTFIGGQALSELIGLLWPAWTDLGGGATFLGLSLPLWLAFLGFWLVNVAFVYKGTESIKWLENIAAPFLLLVGLALLYWAASRTGGLGVILGQSSALQQGPKDMPLGTWLVGVFLPGLTAMVGFWATLSLNIPDFTRYCRNQREQLLGQLYGLPTTMLLFSFIGVAVTSATLILYGEAIWDPVKLVVRMSRETGSTALAVLAMLTLAIATLSTNIAANVVGPANSLANAFPRALDFRRGGLVAAAVGILVCPWLLLDVYTAWLVSYSGLLGAVSGVLLTDYWLVRRTELDLEALYRSHGAYTYRGGFNPDAMLALAAGVLVVLLGKLVPGLEFLFQGAWFSGFLASAAVYLARTRRP